MINQLFKKAPSRDLANRYVRCMGLSGLSDSSWFSGMTMQQNKAVSRVNEHMKPELEPLYIRCKAKSYLTDIDERGVLTILRQILRVHNYTVMTRSKCQKGRRFVQYRIIPSTDY